MEKLCIAVDGPAGSGKSTIAKIVADRLDYKYLDTGAMYRAVCWEAIRKNIAFTDEESLSELVRTLDLSLEYFDGVTTVNVDRQDVTAEIRSMEVTNAVSLLAQSQSVRAALVHMQQRLSRDGGIVMDGRDIGTVVLPNAELKVFLTASVEERTRRRWQELRNDGVNVDFDELKKTIVARDYTDSNREIAPLTQAKDAILIDTTQMTVVQVADEICRLCEARC